MKDAFHFGLNWEESSHVGSSVIPTAGYLMEVG